MQLFDVPLDPPLGKGCWAENPPAWTLRVAFALSYIKQHSKQDNLYVILISSKKSKTFQCVLRPGGFYD